MIINKIHTKNFRNLKEIFLEIPASGLLIYGKNGCGKTNLLEAISYFSFGKSFRYLSDREIIEFGKESFFLEANFTIYNTSRNIKVKVGIDKKMIFIDNKVLKKITELYKFVKMVYFSPNDIEIASGYPNSRRRFFDIAISQFSYNYLESLRVYNRILKQRNALLKRDYTNNEKKVWDKQLLSTASIVIFERLSYLQGFNKQLNEIYNGISNNSEKVSIEYLPKYKIDKGEIYNFLSKELEQKKKEENIYQRTMFGPHLHDYRFLINGKIVKKYASQGQKRSFVIALRLAQAKMIDISQNESPILIFDDVLSELDGERTNNIFNLLGNKHQIFIATPNRYNYSKLNLKSLNLEEFLK